MRITLSYQVGRRTQAFTLIEMLIVLFVIAALAMVVFPSLTGVNRKAREADLAGQLRSLREAIQQFENDCGDYPATLDQLLVRPSTAMGGGGIAIDPDDWQGPYLIVFNGALPKDPFTESYVTWQYTPATGEVRSGAALVSLKMEQPGPFAGTLADVQERIRQAYR